MRFQETETVELKSIVMDTSKAYTVLDISSMFELPKKDICKTIPYEKSKNLSV